MIFSEYRKLTVKTQSDTGSKITDSCHMTLGLNTEIVGELPEALANEDLVNFKEELGDAYWYLSNYCNIWEITPKNTLGDFPEDKWNILKLDKSAGQQYMIIFGIGQNIAKLQDGDKKHLAYGKHFNEETRQALVDEIYSVIEYFAWVLGIDTGAVMQTNIDKLAARYPGLIFNADKANNRDLDSERVILENGN